MYDRHNGSRYLYYDIHAARDEGGPCTEITALAKLYNSKFKGRVRVSYTIAHIIIYL